MNCTDNSNEKNRMKLNFLISLGSQIIIIVLGLIIPRIVLTHYGSDTNGLTSTVSQIFTYLALLEAGISQAARNALYSPLKSNSIEEISKVVSTARRYYRRISLFYFLIVVVLSITLPFILKTDVAFITICIYVLFEGLTNVISFFYLNTWNCFLFASGKNYVVNAITLLTRILTYGVKIALVYMSVNIAVIQIGYFIVSLIQLSIYQYYMKKNFSWINYDAAEKTSKLPDRKSYIITEIAWTVFSATDMIVLSVFVSTKMSSVYAVYSMIFTNISLLVNSVYSSLCYLLGQTYHDNIEKYKIVHDIYNSAFMSVITILMSVCYLLTIPFVKLYTSGIKDIDYVYPALPILFCLVQMLSWSRYVSGNLTGIAGYAKPTSFVSLIEASINIVLSVLLVQKYGIVGVLFATVIALPLKAVWCTYIAEKKVLKRSCGKTLLILGGNYVFFAFIVIASKMIRIDIKSYSDFVVWGIVLTSSIACLNTLINCCTNQSYWDSLKKVVKGIIKK